MGAYCDGNVLLFLRNKIGGVAMRFLSIFCYALASGIMLSNSGSVCATATQPLRAVPFTDVSINDDFWKPRQETNRKVSIPHSLEMLKKAGNIHDLEIAAAGKPDGYIGPIFIDSDLYKAIEAAGYSLAAHPDPELEKRVDEIIGKIAAAQMPDGYLNTWFQVNAPERRWSNLRDEHELYCAGHLFEGAVAYHAATGKRELLDVAVRFADHIEKIFGAGPGKRQGYCGHPEIELALMKLHRATGEKRYLELARFFMDTRGSKFFAQEHKQDESKYDGKYWQDNVPLRDHKQVVGHAVRAVYLMSGATDLAAVTRDAALTNMLERVWNNTTGCNMYVTGGIGSSAANEGFTFDYDLPNLSAYQETCASIAMVMWNHRLNLLHRDAKFIDALERALYNGFLAGVSLDGKSFFYVNPLESKGTHHRQEWYGCACCPPNVTRTLAQLGGYAYATADDSLFVNLYIAGQAKANVADTSVTVDVQTRYPWEEDVTLQLTPEAPANFALKLRVPEWCDEPALTVAGERAQIKKDRGYITIDREWKSGDTVELQLPMPVQRVSAHPNVAQNRGRLAIQRGPIVYCLEQIDNGFPVTQASIAPDAKFVAEKDDTLVTGGLRLKTRAQVAESQAYWDENLYAPPPKAREVDAVAIPYALWDNRAAGEMAVWIPTSL